MSVLNKTIKLYNHIIWYVNRYNNSPPTVPYLAKYMQTDEKEVVKLLDDLSKQGKLKRLNNKFSIPAVSKKDNPVKEDDKKTDETESVPLSIDSVVSANEKKEAIKLKTAGVQSTKSFHAFPRIKKNLNLPAVFNFIIFAVFLDFVYIGIKYNYYGNLDFKDRIDALTSAAAFMLAAIVFFKKFIEKAKEKKPIALLYFCIYLCLFAYNTMTVLQYQYEKYQDKLYSQENVENTSKINQSEIITKKISIIEKEIQDIETEKNRQEKILSALTTDDKQYNFYFWQINGSNGFLKKLESKRSALNKLFDEKSNLSKEIKTDKTKSRLLSGKLLTVYLFFPAFCIELLASISLVLLLESKKNRQGYKNHPAA